MRKRLLACVATAALALATGACHSAGRAQPADDGGADAAESGPCVCEATSGGANVVIACAATGCIDGSEVLCSGAGDLIAIGGACGDAGADAGDGGSDGGPCNPTCDSHSCGSPDGCGGVCKCRPGVTCNPDQTCGNGCNLIGQQACVVGSASAASCCSDGYQCKGGDAGAAPAVCCTVTGSNGTCAQNTDCCDYPAASCDTFSNTCN